jgi:HD superfamily phosphohydrolase YqeK
VEQLLDPTRIDHFVRVAELSEELVAPLRVLAEQQAVAG